MEPKSKRIFVHIGYPKTGTTTLQRGLFLSHPEIAYLGKPFDKEFRRIWRHVMRSSDTAFERGMRRTAQAVAATLGKVNGKVILLSDEDILCYNAFGSTTIWRNIDRVCRLFQDPLVRGVSLSLVLTIRRQDHLIPSFCAQYHALEAERVDWAEFIDRRLGCPEYGLFGTLFFHKVVDYCIQHVGYDNVHVLLFEKLTQAPHDFAKQLAAIMGIESNLCDMSLRQPRYNVSQRNGKAFVTKYSDVLRHLYRFHSASPAFFRRLHRGLPKGLKRAIRRLCPGQDILINITPEQERAIREVYRYGNQLLEEQFRIPASAYGYT